MIVSVMTVDKELVLSLAYNSKTAFARMQALKPLVSGYSPRKLLCCSLEVPQSAVESSHLLDQLPGNQMINF